MELLLQLPEPTRTGGWAAARRRDNTGQVTSQPHPALTKTRNKKVTKKRLDEIFSGRVGSHSSPYWLGLGRGNIIRHYGSICAFMTL